MAHHCEFKCDLTKITNEMIETTYYASWKDKRLDVIKYTLFIDGIEQIKYRDNLRYSSMGGWLVGFPNEKRNSWYYGYEEVKLYEYRESDILPNVAYYSDETYFLEQKKKGDFTPLFYMTL